MKKIYLVLAVFSLFLMSSCIRDSDLANTIVGEWEVKNIKEYSWWYYIDVDGTQTETFYNYDNYQLTPEHPEWHVFRFTKLFMSITDGGSEIDEAVIGMPLPYTLKGDKLSSLLLIYDHTNEVTVSFANDDTMEFYVNDSGEFEDGDGYEHYESWITFKRLK